MYTLDQLDELSCSFVTIKDSNNDNIMYRVHCCQNDLNIDAYLQILIRDTKPSRSYFVSIHNPEYIVDDCKMSDIDKENVMNDLPNKWNRIIDGINDECKSMCRECTKNCKSFMNRQLNITCPNYRLL